MIIAGCFVFELFLARPEWAGVLGGLVPTTQIVTDPAMLYIAIGILGATVMPHNLYLHSSIVQTRAFAKDTAGKRDAITMATIDGTVALGLAFFINAAILILAAATFHVAGRTDVAEIDQAYELLAPMLGMGAASVLFAVALLASGQNSTVTGTLAGQIVMEGFLNLRMPVWARRLVTRLLAIVPAVFVVGASGDAGSDEAAGAESGRAQPAAPVRGRAARQVYRRPHDHGRTGQPGVVEDPRLGDRGGDHRAERHASVRHAVDTKTAADRSAAASFFVSVG
ncbi:Nramp family divalent metal transporter [Sphingomonas sp. H160509]|uniref:Nramp family divalent metal transporter n=1 Tax=Sphingomonas sp. H160509 TaxID=2955313 RepID=UPI00406BF5F2